MYVMHKKGNNNNNVVLLHVACCKSSVSHLPYQRGNPIDVGISQGNYLLLHRTSNIEHVATVRQ